MAEPLLFFKFVDLIFSWIIPIYICSKKPVIVLITIRNIVEMYLKIAHITNTI